MSFADLLEQWDLIEADLQDGGVDVEDTALMRSRTWRWLRTRIVGLLAKDTTRLARHFAPPPEVDDISIER